MVLILALSFLLLVAVYVTEYILHKVRRNKIPVRVHVNGTRGKSSVTRLIAAGLRAGGKRVCAKTTGTLPRMIMPDGREFPLFRPGRTNIIEQIRVMAAAAAQKADVLVIECMALQPYLQWISEGKIVKATHGVITNIRADHLDVMGPGEEEVGYALCGMVPRKGRIYSSERRHQDIIRFAAKDRKSEACFVTDPTEIEEAEKSVSRFLYQEHPDNIALALKICEDLGVDREVALTGMASCQPDPGALMDFEVDFFGKTFQFVNAFAANDPESTKEIWEKALHRHAGMKKKIALFNCRLDRADRSLQLAEDFPSWKQADHVVLIGTGTYIFGRMLVKKGLSPTVIHYADENAVSEIFETLMDLIDESAVIVGMANIAGPGLELVRFFKNRAKKESK